MNQDPPPAKRLQFTESSDDGYKFLAINYFKIEIYTLVFRHNAMACLIDYSII